MEHTLRLGSRNSAMAKMVAQYAKEQIERLHPDIHIEMLGFASTGDKNQGDLSKLGGKGAFVKDLEQRLLDHEIDFAIHALKDVPGDIDPHPDLTLACYLEREDPRDALIMRDGMAVPITGEGLTLATSSPRRQAFLRQLYPQARIIPLRGNVDTRLKKLQAGEFDGMVLAYSGLQRLNYTQYVTHIYTPEEMLPAVGQGVLTLQVRKADLAKCSFLQAIHSSTSGRAVAAERALLRVLEGNCYAAIAGYCTEDSTTRRMRAWVANPTGTERLMADLNQPLDGNPEQLGEEAARQLITQGARNFIDCKAA